MSLGGIGKTVSSATSGLPVSSATDAVNGLNATDAIGSEGLSVIGLVGIGSNEQNAIDLMPKEKKEAYLERRKNAKTEEEKLALQRELEKSTGKRVIGEDDEELAERAKRGEGAGGPLQKGPLSSTDGLTRGVPLDAAKGATGGGGPLDTAKGLTSGPLDTTKGLTSGVTDGVPTDAAVGLIGGGKGLNVGGLIGLGSDEEAAIDLLPAEKQKTVAERYKNAKSEKEKKALMDKVMREADKEADKMGLDDDQRADLADVSREERQQFLRDYQEASPREKAQLSRDLQRQATAARTRKKEQQESGNSEGNKGLLGGKGPLSGGSPLDTAKGVTGGGGPLDSAKDLTGGPVDTVGGLGGGLIGGGKGLNVGGLIGLGSDEEAAVDLLPAEKKKAFIERYKGAKSEEEKAYLRKKLMEQASKEAEASNLNDQDREALRDMDSESRQRHVRAMREADTPAKRARIRESMRETSRAQSGGSEGRAMCLPMCTHEASSYESRPSLFYSYLVPSSRGKGKGDSYMLTFADATVADRWYDEASSSYDVERPSHQFFSYRGDAPKTVSPSISRKMHATRLESMECFPVLPLQTVDGYMVGPRYQQSYVVNRSCSSCGSGMSSSSHRESKERDDLRRRIDSYEEERVEMERRHTSSMSRLQREHEASEERFRQREKEWNETRRDYDRRMRSMEEKLNSQSRHHESSTSRSSFRRSEHNHGRNESFDDDDDDDWLADSKGTSSFDNGNGRGHGRSGRRDRLSSDSSDDWLEDFDEEYSSGARTSKGRRDAANDDGNDDDDWLNESSETSRHKTKKVSHSTSSSSRNRWTMESMAREHARHQVAEGDSRSEERIYRETLADLRADCTNCH